jgi:membrane associated rhomboid family serine protease
MKIPKVIKKNPYKASIGLFLVSALIQMVCDKFPDLTNLLAFVPDRGAAGMVGLVTYQLAHVGWAHLLGNFSFGAPALLYLERMLGSKRMLEFYFICGLGSALVHCLMQNGGLIGSSGSIYGAMAGACLSFGQSKTEHAIGVCLASLLFLQNLLLAPMGALFGVAFYGHVGGMVTAMVLLSRLYQPKPLKP